MTRQQLATTATALANGVNLAAVILHLWTGQVTLAGLQSLLLVGVNAWWWLSPRIDSILQTRVAILEAQKGTAIAGQRIQEAHARMTDLARAAMEEQARQGTVRVVAERAH